MLDVGDTLASALLTGLGPGVSHYFLAQEMLGDGTFSGRDVDLYRFAAQNGDRLLAATNAPTGTASNADTVLRLFDENGTELTSNDDHAHLARDPHLFSALDHRFTTAGTRTYYVGVSGHPNESYDPRTGGNGLPASRPGAYRLDLLLLAASPPLAQDAGDTLATAQNLVFAGGGSRATPVSERLGTGSPAVPTRDVDLYRFQASAGTTLQAATSAPAPPGNVDTFLRLFDASGSELTTDADGGPGLPGRDGEGYYSLLQYSFPAAGTYYLGVSGFGNHSYNPTTTTGRIPGSPGAYRLDVALTPVPRATRFAVSAPAATTAGQPFAVTVRATDSVGNTVPSYRGTVTFWTSEPSGGVLPYDYTFTTADAGVHTFPGEATLYVAGTWDITAADTADPTVTGRGPVAVVPGPLAYFALSPESGYVRPGWSFDLDVVALDAFSNVLTDYTGAVGFFSSDPAASLPEEYTFQPADGGRAYFPAGVALVTTGIQELYVFDTATFTAYGQATYQVGDDRGPPTGPDPGGAASLVLALVSTPLRLAPALIEPAASAEQVRVDLFFAALAEYQRPASPQARQKPMSVEGAEMVIRFPEIDGLLPGLVRPAGGGSRWLAINLAHTW